MEAKFDVAAWEAWRRAEVEAAGNDPDAWIRTAENLFVSGALLFSTYTSALKIVLRNVLSGGPDTDRPRSPAEESSVRTGLQVHSTAMMLFGFGIECLLKASFLRRGGTLYRNGRFANPKRLEQSHNLLELSEALGCASLLTDQQLDVLDLLSARNEMGRYPVHSRHDSYGVQPPGPDGVARFYGSWDATRSELVFEAVQALYVALGEEVPPAAHALLEDARVTRTSYGMPYER